MIRLSSNGDYWQVGWTDSRGMRRRKSLGSKKNLSKRDAEARVQELAIEFELYPRLTDMLSSPKLSEWEAQYFIRRDSALQPSTKAIHQQTFSLLTEYFGDRALDCFTRVGCADFRLWLAGKMSESTTCKHIRVAKVIFSWALKEDRLKFNPFDHVSGTAPTRDVEHRILSEEEGRAIVDAAGAYKSLVGLLFYAGLRKMEAFNLKWGDVDLPGGKIIIRNHVGHVTSKSKTRVVRIEPDLKDILSRDLAIADDDFCSTMWYKHNMILKVLDSVRKQVGITDKITCQTFRRTRDVLWHQSYPSFVVSAWMGHSEAVSRKHYLEVPADMYT